MENDENIILDLEELKQIEEDFNSSNSIDNDYEDKNSITTLHNMSVSPIPKFLIDSSDCNIIFNNEFELMNYIKNNSSFDYEYYRFTINKENYKVKMVMRSIESITHFILQYHVKIL
jgi:hypothetical protein